MTSLSIVTTTSDNWRDRDGSLAVLRDLLGQQELPYPTEWCIVDGGSTDATADFLSELSGRRLANGIQVHTESSDRYSSRAAGRNRGIERAAGDVCLFLDDDTFPVSRTCLDDAIGAWDGDGVACGARRYWSPRTWTAADVRDALRERNTPVSEWAHLPVDSLNRRDGEANLQEFSSLSNFGLASRDAITGVGGFDEGFTDWGFEGRELLVRLLRQ